MENESRKLAHVVTLSGHMHNNFSSAQQFSELYALVSPIIVLSN